MKITERPGKDGGHDTEGGLSRVRGQTAKTVSRKAKYGKASFMVVYQRCRLSAAHPGTQIF